MTYTQQGDKVTLEMTRADFDRLIWALGIAAGALSREGLDQTFWNLIAFTNDLNATNPNYVPYEIPEEFRGAR